MSFYEINRKILNQNQGGYLYRFLSNAGEGMSVFLWQTQEDEKLEKFQISLKNQTLEWSRKEGKLKYGNIDEGDNPMKMKKSPLIMMGEKIPAGFAQEVFGIIDKDDIKEFPELKKIKALIRKEI